MPRVIAFDTETELIARGRQVPSIVVLSFAELDMSVPRGQPPVLKSKGLISRHDFLAWLLPLLDDPDVILVGASTAFDVLVTSALWPNPDPDAPAYNEQVLGRWCRAYDQGRVTDVLTRQKLLDLAAGCYRREQLPTGHWLHHKYNLEAVAWRLCRMRLNKGGVGSSGKSKKISTALTPDEQDELLSNSSEDGDTEGDSWRLRYAELKDVPIELWPQAARDYALDDAVATALVWWEQESGRPVARATTATATTAATATADGINIGSGSTDANGLGAALSNMTELAVRKGTLTRGYPVEYSGMRWSDAEAAYQALKEHSADATEHNDRLMAKIISAKFQQHDRILRAVVQRGGAAWLKRCSHFVEAKTPQGQAWEGRGEQSRFIRNLIAGFKAATHQWCIEKAAIHGPQPQLAPIAQGLSSQLATPTAPPTPNLVDVAGSLWKRIYENFSANEDPLIDEHRQARSALWLRAMSAHGLRTDGNAVEKFATWVEGKYHEITQRLVVAGLVRVEYHLDKKALAEWVAARCRAMNTEDVGTLKKALIHLAGLLGEDDPDSAVALCAANWLRIVRTLRGVHRAFHEATDESYAENGDTLEAALRAETQQQFETLEKHGLANRTYHRDTKAAAAAMVVACERAGVNVPRTESYDPGKHTEFQCVALDKEACGSVRDGDTDGALADYAELSHFGKMRSADVPVLRGGVIAPIHTHFEELLETGRTGSSAPNVQNVARGDKDRPGARECYIPRELIWDASQGILVPSVMVDSDYALGELHTLAQACLWLIGHSKLAEALQSGRDPHTAMACEILGIPYAMGKKLKEAKDADFDNARNSGKAINFGKPGGLGVETMRAYGIRSYGVDLPTRCGCPDITLPSCKCRTWEKLLKLWESLWTEMPAYFRWVDAQRARVVRSGAGSTLGGLGSGKGGHGSGGKREQLYNIRQPFSLRLRAGATYCSGCNSVFQGLLADVAKRAGWYLFKACYLSPSVLLSLNIRLQEKPHSSREEYELNIHQSAPIYGCRPINFIHDQFLVEAPETRGDAAANVTGLLMDRAGEEILPDVPVKCEPILARRWSKRAGKVKDKEGRLLAWELDALKKPS